MHVMRNTAFWILWKLQTCTCISKKEKLCSFKVMEANNNLNFAMLFNKNFLINKLFLKLHSFVFGIKLYSFLCTTYKKIVHSKMLITTSVLCDSILYSGKI